MPKLFDTRGTLQSIIDCIPDSIFVKDLRGKYLLTNTAFRRNVDPIGGSILGRTADEVFPRDRAEEFASADHQVMVEGKTVTTENVGLVSGQPRAFMVLRAPLLDRQARTIGLVGIARDVTDRKRAEDALRLGEARFRETIESLPFVTAVYRADGVAEFCNRRFVDYFGQDFSLDPSVQVPLMHPDDRARSAAARAGTLASGAGYQIDVRLRRRDGAYRWHRVNTVPLQYGGMRVAGFVTTLVDIQEARQAEKLLQDLNAALEERVAERTKALNEVATRLADEIRRRQETQAALLQSQKLEALGQLVGGVAHDFNNVLAAIMGSYSLIRGRVADPKLHRIVELGESAAQRALFLTRRLVGFARREDLKPTPIIVAHFIEDFLRVLPHSLGPGIEIDVQMHQPVSPMLADRQALELILINLALNARDAMASKGRITIAARDLAHQAGDRWQLKPGAYVVVSVADCGAGMSAETLRRATEPFFTTKGVGKGSGLGLAMVHGLVKQLAGDMTIDSEEGKGTVVQLAFPCSPGEDHPAPEPAVPAMEFAGTGNILLVEDDDEVRPITESMLRAFGYTVFSAASASAAFSLEATLGIMDLVITDVGMADVDGIALAARMRSTRPDLPVLFITGFATLAANLAGERVLRKPFTMSELGHATREALLERTTSRLPA